MKLGLLILLLCTARAMADSDLVAKPAPRPRLTEELRRQATVVSAAARENGPFSRSSRDMGPRAPARGIESNHGIVSTPDLPPPESRPFNLEEGGTYRERDGAIFTSELMVQYDAPNNGWDLLKISW
ncbi:MAG: hypothetical protein WCA95_10505 [Opitutaceae bacterium]|jgi:hypothetical protein